MTAAAYLEDFETVTAEGSAEPEWLRPLRRGAIEKFGALGFPTPKNEDWHYTSVAPIVEADYRALTGRTGSARAEHLTPFTFGQPTWPMLVFLNGRFSSELSTGVMPAGIEAMSLERAMRETPGLVKPHLARLANFEDASFTALNTAFMRDGAVIRIADNASIDVPIHLLFVSDAEAAKGIVHPRSLILAGRNSKANVIESYVALGNAGYFTNAVTEVALEDGATLGHYKIQRESIRAYHVGTTQVHQARDSHYISFSFAIGGALSRTNIYTDLDGEGSGVTLNGLYMVDGEQHVDHQTAIIHAQPNCFSRQLYKGILDGASHGVFNGKVYVHPIAQKTDGKQTNNTLLLSERARIDTKPQLEIFADDVKCTHGATVGRLDPTALFYMKSRGINAERARQLLTYAFAADVLETIELEPLKDALEALALQRFTTEGEG